MNKEIFTVNANLFRNSVSDGGKLIIFEDGLLFKPHSFNLDTNNVWIPISEVKNIEKFNSIFIIPNGLRINCKLGSFDFVVSKREETIKIIEQLLRR